MPKRDEPVLRPRIRVTRGAAIAIGPGKADLLEAILESGSIRKAAEDLGMSYMRAWSLVRTMNESFREPLVLQTRGGARHGGAELSEHGIRVLELYREMERTARLAMVPAWRKMKRMMKTKDEGKITDQR